MDRPCTTIRILAITAPTSFEDLLRRYLKYRGYNVTQVMNLTDVEDKIIRDSQKARRAAARLYGDLHEDIF